MATGTTARRRLLVAIHDVGPRFESEVEMLRAGLAPHVPVNRTAMLVVPNHWSEAPIIRGSAFATRLRAWADSGVEMFVHGWFHRDLAKHAGVIERFKARHMTAREGEFLGLNAASSAHLMADGRALIEDIIGRPVAGFVAPAWLYGPGALQALATSRFAIAEDHWRVWNPLSGRILCRSPVITWASRSRARIASSLLAARLLPTVLRATPIVRLAVHPGDAHVPALCHSIDRTLGRLCRHRLPIRYTDLLG